MMSATSWKNIDLFNSGSDRDGQEGQECRIGHRPSLKQVRPHDKDSVPSSNEHRTTLPDENNKLTGTCPICYCDYTIQDGMTMADCSHEFCKDCISTYIQTKATEGAVMPNQMICPCIDPSLCGRPIAQVDVLACLTKSDDRDRYLRLTVERAVDVQDNLGCCPTAGCTFQFEWDESNRKLECPLCQKSYCLVCQVGPWHAGVRCEQFQEERIQTKEDKEFRAFAANRNLKQCPQCKFWVEKKSGCNAMHCRCNVVFCYACGGCLKGTASKNGFKECKCSSSQSFLRAHEGGSRNINRPDAPPRVAAVRVHRNVNRPDAPPRAPYVAGVPMRTRYRPGAPPRVALPMPARQPLFRANGREAARPEKRGWRGWL